MRGRSWSKICFAAWTRGCPVAYLAPEYSPLAVFLFFFSLSALGALSPGLLGLMQAIYMQLIPTIIVSLV